jgi:hypothetical protein
MQQFEIVLKNNNIRSYRFIALMLVILNLAIFIFLLFSDSYFVDALSDLILVCIYAIFRFYQSRKNKAFFFIDEVAFFVLAGCWIVLHHYLFAIFCALIGTLYHFSLQKIHFVFSGELIIRMNFPRTEYQWAKFNNVMLRDGILTLDFTDNKLIQMEVEDNITINEFEFNAFAKQKIKQYSQHYQNPFSK